MTTRTRERRAKQAARRRVRLDADGLPVNAVRRDADGNFVPIRMVKYPEPITAEAHIKMGGEIAPALTVGALRAKLAGLPEDAPIYIYDHQTSWTHHPELLAPIIAVSGPYPDHDEPRVTLHQGPPEENEP